MGNDMQQLTLMEYVKTLSDISLEKFLRATIESWLVTATVEMTLVVRDLHDPYEGFTQCIQGGDICTVSMETRIGASCSSSPTIFVCNMIVYILMLRFPRLFGKRFHVLFFHWIHSIPQCIYLYNFIFLNYGLCVSFLQLTYRYCLQNINPIPCCLSPWLPKPPLAQR